ncbi:unnamed protein product [Pylaiella littoralis]
MAGESAETHSTATPPPVHPRLQRSRFLPDKRAESPERGPSQHSATHRYLQRPLGREPSALSVSKCFVAIRCSLPSNGSSGDGLRDLLKHATACDNLLTSPTGCSRPGTTTARDGEAAAAELFFFSMPLCRQPSVANRNEWGLRCIPDWSGPGCECGTGVSLLEEVSRAPVNCVRARSGGKKARGGRSPAPVSYVRARRGGKKVHDSRS